MKIIHKKDMLRKIFSIVDETVQDIIDIIGSPGYKSIVFKLTYALSLIFSFSLFKFQPF